MSEKTKTARKVADTEVGCWMMTAPQAEWLTEGRDGGKSLLEQAGLTLPEAMEKYGSVAGKWVCNSILTDINDARAEARGEKMVGKNVRPSQMQFAVALFAAATSGPKVLRKKVAPVLESVLDRCVPESMLEEGETAADRFQVHSAIEFALTWFNGTGTALPPKPKGADTPNGDGDENDEPTL